MKHLIFVLGIVTLMATPSSWAQEKPGKEGIKVSSERVQKLFDTMREGKYKDIKFPDLNRKDIPALLELGASKHVLRSFPVNPISSQAEPESPEGMVALWLVEGIRKGGKDFPSLNPLCLPDGEKAGKWTEVSAMNQDQVLKAYREWWKLTESLPEEKAAEIDPLKGTKLHWY